MQVGDRIVTLPLRDGVLPEVVEVRRAHGRCDCRARLARSREGMGADAKACNQGGGSMTKQTWKTMMARLTLVSVCVLHLAGCTGNIALGPDAVKGKVPDGTIEMHEVQAAYLASGSGGAGVLSFRGVEYPFDVGGPASGALASPPSRRRARSTTSATSGSSRAPMARPATALRSAPRVAAISGCRTRRG